MSRLVAYIDESKSQKYVLVAVVFDSNAAPSSRKQLKHMRMKGQRRLQMRKESAQRKVVLVRNLNRLTCSIFAIVSNVKSEAQAREICLSLLVMQLLEAGVERMEIERDVSFEQLDKSVIKRVFLAANSTESAFRHLSGSEEPLLWAADIAAWAVQNGQPGQFPRCQVTNVH